MGVPDAVLVIVSVFGLLAVPALGFVLCVALDRACRGRAGRLESVSLGVAGAASVLLLVLPLYADASPPGAGSSPERPAVTRRNALETGGMRAALVAAVPVRAAALPRLAWLVVSGGGTRAWPTGFWLGIRVAAACLMTGVMYYGSTSLVGFLYLPSAAAMAAAAARTRFPPAPEGRVSSALRIATAVGVGIPVLFGVLLLLVLVGGGGIRGGSMQRVVVPPLPAGPSAPP